MYSISSNITNKIIKAALTVYNELGYGFLEKYYSRCLQFELQQLGIKSEIEKKITISYKNVIFSDYYIDLVANYDIIIELKTVNNLISTHFKQVKNYMKATGIATAFIFNFSPDKLVWHRVFLK